MTLGMVAGQCRHPPRQSPSTPNLQRPRQLLSSRAHHLLDAIPHTATNRADGTRVRVMAPVRVHHVSKAPDLDQHLLPPPTPQPPPPNNQGRSLGTARQVVAADVSSSPSDVAAEEAAAAPQIGKRVRVMAPVRVHHVSKAPDLDLRGMEGVVKQYVGVWKGKRITANLPFKVEFELRVDGQDKPVRFFAHLREDEFELVGDE
uniref:Ferredoxin thioredoxin reductase alpha chain domain-containing protein n=1 Tax=Oryza brachyantha TaxID=4533 RepID=J3LZT0_ORYBR